MQMIEPFSIVPAIAGLVGVLIMTIFLRRAKLFHLPETQMIRAIGSMITKNVDTALLPGTVIHVIGGIVFAYCYAILLSTAPQTDNKAVVVVVCVVIGFVHGLIVTLFLVISVSQYHPVERFRRLNPGDMAAHVIGHLSYGLTVGLILAFFDLI